MRLYIQKYEAALNEKGNPADAVAMKQYMQGQFDFVGVKAPVRREITAAFLHQEGFPEVGDMTVFARECWAHPAREMQYFAMELLFSKRKRLPEEYLNLFEEMIVQKSWWDTVDFISAKQVAFHFEKYPPLMPPCVQRWMDSGNIWLQRSCLLFQLHRKKKTDTDLLERLITQLQGSREFFINKAIGWVLREYSKTNPEWVTAFAGAHPLAPLSRREALKWLQKKEKV